MKKIGFLFGVNNAFSLDVMQNINLRKKDGIIAEEIKIDIMGIDDLVEYDVILDRVSQFVPFYSTVLKYAELRGCHVINNPFWECADDNFFNFALSHQMNIKVPRTVIIPSKALPKGVTNESMRNLAYPLDWDAMFEYVGFPAYLKANIRSSYNNDFKIYNPQEFFSAYDLTGDTTMIFQESIEFDDYYKCFVIGKKYVKIIKYYPLRPQHLRYSEEEPMLTEEMIESIEKSCSTVSTVLGFDFNSVEFAIKDNEIYAVEFHDINPILDRNVIKQNNYNWLINITADYLIEIADSETPRQKKYCWTDYLSDNPI